MIPLSMWIDAYHRMRIALSYQERQYQFAEFLCLADKGQFIKSIREGKILSGESGDIFHCLTDDFDMFHIRFFRRVGKGKKP